MECLYVARECIIHQLNEDPQPTLEIICFNHFENALILLAHSHNSDFVHNNRAFFVGLWLYKLERTNIAIRFPFNLKYFGETTLAQLANNVVVLGRIIR